MGRREERAATMARRRRAPGERSRGRILAQAARLATVEGLDGLSIGRLAEATGMPKSSVYALFGSKEELQLATIEAARASFVEEVVTPALGPGRPGRVHDRVAAYQREWRDLPERAAREAAEAGELPADADPGQLAFELSTILSVAN